MLKSLQTYAKVYASIGTVPKSREEIRCSLKEFKDKQSDNTIRNHLNDTFAGKLPLITIKDDKAVLDVAELRSFIERLCKTLGTDASILFTGPVPAPKGRKDSDAQIPSIDGVQPSPAMVNMKKSLAEAVKKEKELAEAERKRAEREIEIIYEKYAPYLKYDVKRRIKNRQFKKRKRLERKNRPPRPYIPPQRTAEEQKAIDTEMKRLYKEYHVSAVGRMARHLKEKYRKQ